MMDRNKLKELIRAGEIRKIFIEHLGWDSGGGGGGFSIAADFAGQNYELAVEIAAQKRGFVLCRANCESMPPKSARQKLERQLSRLHYEHLLVLQDNAGGQIWTAAIKRPDKPRRLVEIELRRGQDPEFLVHKLEGLVFSLQEEGGLAITDVVDKIDANFAQNAERVTKQFYERFRKELAKFQKFIKGLQKQVDKEQYAALMLNRLMFIYFIQNKNFLDGDSKYLQNRLRLMQTKHGKDKFYKGFYRHFLITLFHRGLGAPEESRAPETKKLIGKVPYLNGGLFDESELEINYGADINIPDKAFDELFKFFDKYRWHLDDNITASGRDINPDVIGYIFEKYINDRAEMGAYYTQEDITGYIARNTILPHLLRKARENCREAFDKKTGTIWKLLRENPDNYIYDSVRKGGGLSDSALPDNIKCGLDANAPDLLQRREKWNTAAAEEWALPTETWRETLTRRARYLSLKKKIQSGKITEIANLITHNLDIEKLTLDFLEQHEGADLISAFFAAIAGRQRIEGRPDKESRGISVLDPACGSGAFLFAALNVLEPLYAACLERMQEFTDDDDELRKNGKRKGAVKHKNFRAVLDEMKTHINPRYWIYRSIVLGNLFGVDIMPEAAEVAKLRLFLKLAAEAEKDDSKPNMGLEPLPDIDFNIRTGNTLVGFASVKNFEESAKAKLDLTGGATEIYLQLGIVGLAYRRFIDSQTVADINSEKFKAAKLGLRGKLRKLNNTLNEYLSFDYGVSQQIGELWNAKMLRWCNSHKPFHWFAEFYEIMSSGGFDVIIGNPPYVRYTDELKKSYTVKNYATESCCDLYAFFMERSKMICNSAAPMGMIIPLPAFAVDKMLPLRNFFADNNTALYISFYSVSPAKLFKDAKQRLAILLQIPKHRGIMTTNYLNWKPEYRPYLIDTFAYTPTISADMTTISKIGNAIELRIYEKINAQKQLLNFLSDKNTQYGVYFHDAPEFWTRATNFIPYFYNDRDGERQSTHVKSLYVRNKETDSLCAIINSSLFCWWFVVMSDCRDLNKREFNNFPINLEIFHKSHGRKISLLIVKLMENYRQHIIRRNAYYRTTGNVAYDEFHPRYGKSIMNKIDKILAKHYGFTDEELDYIINYDYKYRMGGADE